MTKSKFQGRVELTLSEANGDEPFLSVKTAIVPESLQSKNIGSRSKKAFRALCILLLLAKDRGEKASDKQRLRFESPATSSTWIRTLATQRDTTITNLLQDLGLKRFWTACRFGKNEFPYVDYFTNKLPLQNITVFTPSSKQALTGMRLREVAIMLEKVLLDAHLPRKEKWEVAIVPHLLQKTDERNGITLPARYDGEAVPLTTSKTMSLGQFQNELFYHLRRNGGEDDSLQLLKRYEDLCNLELSPIWSETPLLTAISFGKAKVVAWMLENLAVDVNQANRRGITPILKAARLNDLSLVERLWDKEADPDARTLQHRHAIHEAVYGATSACLPTIKLFVERGVEPDATDNMRTNPLALALYRKSPQSVIKWLKECGLEDSFTKRLQERIQDAKGKWIRENEHGIYATESQSMAFSDWGRLLRTVTEDNVEAVEDLLTTELPPAVTPFEVNDPNKLGRTTLHEAVEFGRPEMVELLLRYGADPFRQDCYGRIPREYLPHTKTTDRDHFVDSALSRGEQKWIEGEYKSHSSFRTPN